MAVIGRGRACLAEAGAAVAVRAQIAGKRRHVLARRLAEAREIVGESLLLGIDHRVGAIGGDHPALPAARADRAVMIERIERALGGGDHLDAEAIEQRARAEGGGLQRRVDHVVIRSAVAASSRTSMPNTSANTQSSHSARRRAAEQMIMLGEEPPDSRGSVAVGAAVAGRHAERLERHALAIEHAEDIMVGHEQQLRRIGEGLRRRRTRPDRYGRAG